MYLKKLLIIWVVAVVSIFLCQIIFASYHVVNGHTVVWQTRFYKINQAEKVFNPWSLVSPIQVTSFEKNKYSKKFTKKFIFPVSDATLSVDGMQIVANQIKKFTEETKSMLVKNSTYDYDNQSFSVLAKKTLPQVHLPEMKLLLNSSASPEFRKNGFAESIQIGVREPENKKLSQARLENMYSLVTKVHIPNVTFQKGNASETQLKDSAMVRRVLENPSLLDSLRYAEVIIMANGEDITVTPFTTPILPFIFLGLLFLVPYVRIKKTNLTRPQILRSIKNIIPWVLIGCAVIFLGYILREYIIYIIILVTLVTLIYFISQTSWEKGVIKWPRFSWDWFKNFYHFLKKKLLQFLWYLGVILVHWWHRGSWYGKVLLVFILFTIISRLCGWWHWDGW